VVCSEAAVSLGERKRQSRRAVSSRIFYITSMLQARVRGPSRGCGGRLGVKVTIRPFSQHNPTQSEPCPLPSIGSKPPTSDAFEAYIERALVEKWIVFRPTTGSGR
jgi:hypothetical protein